MIRIYKLIELIVYIFYTINLHNLLCPKENYLNVVDYKICPNSQRVEVLCTIDFNLPSGTLLSIGLINHDRGDILMFKCFRL